MPSSVADLFAAASLCPAGDVRWGDSPNGPKPGGFATGVYIVALTDQHDVLTATLATAPISIPAVQGLLDARPECQLREQRPTAKILAARLARFWFPDEVVLYIGRAGPRKRRLPQGEVAKRVSDYYRTALGKRSPHREAGSSKRSATSTSYTFTMGTQMTLSKLRKEWSDTSPSTRAQSPAPRCMTRST